MTQLEWPTCGFSRSKEKLAISAQRGGNRSHGLLINKEKKHKDIIIIIIINEPLQIKKYINKNYTTSS